MSTQRLWLFRHGTAIPHGAKPDFDRELTPQGREESIAAGEYLLENGIEFAACYTSPLVRAAQTADLACAVLGIEAQRRDAVGKSFDAAVALDLLAENDAGAAILVVGHNPSFDQVVYDLTGERLHLEKGALVELSVSGSRARVTVHQDPPQRVWQAAG